MSFKCARRHAAAEPRRRLGLAAPLNVSFCVCWSTAFKCQEEKGFATVQNALGHCKRRARARERK